MLRAKTRHYDEGGWRLVAKAIGNMPLSAHSPRPNPVKDDDESQDPPQLP